MKHASIVAEFRHVRCDSCKVTLHDELAMVCPVCGAVFDSIMSDHAGLAATMKRRRETAGIYHCHARLADQGADALKLVSSQRQLNNEPSAKSDRPIAVHSSMAKSVRSR